MKTSEALKQEWRELYSQELPVIAKERGWPVYLDHCIARIIYDHVAGAKWDTVWQKPAIHNLTDEQLVRCIKAGYSLKRGELNATQINIESLKFRGKA